MPSDLNLHLVQHFGRLLISIPEVSSPHELLSSLKVNHLIETREGKCIHLISFTPHSFSKHLLSASKTTRAKTTKTISVLHIGGGM